MKLIPITFTISLVLMLVLGGFIKGLLAPNIRLDTAEAMVISGLAGISVMIALQVHIISRMNKK